MFYQYHVHVPSFPGSTPQDQATAGRKNEQNDINYMYTGRDSETTDRHPPSPPKNTLQVTIVTTIVSSFKVGVQVLCVRMCVCIS